jgi:hypothetical protein
MNAHPGMMTSSGPDALHNLNQALDRIDAAFDRIQRCSERIHALLLARAKAQGRV